MQVSESASSVLTQELILYSSTAPNVASANDGEDEPSVLSVQMRTIQSLRAQGIMVGLRLTERLLYREATFGGSPLEIARFIGFTLWRNIFGKKADSVKTIDDSYFVYDNDFPWLQGYARVTGVNEVTNLSLDDENAPDEFSGHRSVLTYTAGIIEGAIETLLHDGEATVKGSVDTSGKTQFTLQFHSL